MGRGACGVRVLQEAGAAGRAPGSGSAGKVLPCRPFPGSRAPWQARGVRTHRLSVGDLCFGEGASASPQRGGHATCHSVAHPRRLRRTRGPSVSPWKRHAVHNWELTLVFQPLISADPSASEAIPGAALSDRQRPRSGTLCQGLGSPGPGGLLTCRCLN